MLASAVEPARRPPRGRPGRELIDPSTSTERSLIANVLLGCIPALVLVILAECLLWAVGGATAGHELHASRGFDGRARYLVPQDDGGHRTQMFEKRDEIVVPPRGDAVRVLLFGGSNTEIFPHAELQRLLDQQAAAEGAARRFEVINLGRSGYGSARVAILFTQALQALEPDVVLIYSGHNEFIERGFATDVAERGPPPLLAPLARLRSVRALLPLFGAPAPEPWAMAYEEFRQLTYDQTLQYLEGYRRNLSGMCAAAAEADVPVVLCTVVSNMLAPPWGYAAPAGTSDEQRDVIKRLKDAGRGHLPAWVRVAFDPPLRVRAEDWREYGEPQQTAGELPREVPVLRTLSGELADTTDTWRTPPTHLWPWPDRWSPDVWTLLGAVEALHHATLTPREERLARRAYDFYGELLALCPDEPRGLFQQGLCAYVLGRPEEAAELFARAGAFDRAPRAGNDVTNGMLRAVAAERGVTLVDAAAWFRERCPDGIVGYEVMMDHCHLQAGARVHLMARLAPAIYSAAARAP